MAKIIIANWKMHPTSESGALKLAKISDKKNVVVCPPFVFLNRVSRILKKAKLGSQDVSREEVIAGPFTGEVSAVMLKRLGVSYVIIGHSERRALGDTDEIVSQKIKDALRAGLKVILCVGEPAIVRKKGVPVAKKFVASQIKNNLKNISNIRTFRSSNILIAYEPIWAISTSRDRSLKETPSFILEMVNFIREFLKPITYNLKPKILYGGSVTSLNVGRIIQHNEIDGVLVGGASLNLQEFQKIIKISNQFP